MIRIGRVILINLIIILALIILSEITSRIFLYFTRGSSTIGMPERTLYLSYQPFVMFGPNWDKQLDPIKYQASVKDKYTIRVLLIGGSTAALFPTEILENAFNKKFPNYKFKVINAAEGGYIARQELIVAGIWGPSLSPDIIISLDGANDFIHRLRMKKAGTFYLDAAYSFALTNPFLSPFAHLLRHSQTIQGMQRLTERFTVSSYESYIDAIPVYISAQHSINIIARGLAATRIMVLQPFMSFKDPLSSHELNFTHYKYREKIMMKLYDLVNVQMQELAKKDNVIYLDARLIFNNIKNTIFSDDVHFVDNLGYKLLAENIVNNLTERDVSASKYTLQSSLKKYNTNISK